MSSSTRATRSTLGQLLSACTQLMKMCFPQWRRVESRHVARPELRVPELRRWQLVGAACLHEYLRSFVRSGGAISVTGATASLVLMFSAISRADVQHGLPDLSCSTRRLSSGLDWRWSVCVPDWSHHSQRLELRCVQRRRSANAAIVTVKKDAYLAGQFGGAVYLDSAFLTMSSSNISNAAAANGSLLCSSFLRFFSLAILAQVARCL